MILYFSMVKTLVPFIASLIFLAACDGSSDSKYVLEHDTIDTIYEAPGASGVVLYDPSFQGLLEFSKVQCRRRITENRVVDFLPFEMQEFLNIPRLAYVDEYVTNEDPESGIAYFLIGNYQNLDMSQNRREYWLSTFKDGQFKGTKLLVDYDASRCGNPNIFPKFLDDIVYWQVQYDGCLYQALEGEPERYFPETITYWSVDENGAPRTMHDPYYWLCIEQSLLSYPEQVFVALPRQNQSPFERMLALINSEKTVVNGHPEICQSFSYDLAITIDSINPGANYMKYHSYDDPFVKKEQEIKLWDNGDKILVAQTRLEIFDGQTDYNIIFYEYDKNERRVTHVYFTSLLPKLSIKDFVEGSSMEYQAICSAEYYEYDFQSHINGYFRIYLRSNSCDLPLKYDFAMLRFVDGGFELIGMYTEESWEAEQI